MDYTEPAPITPSKSPNTPAGEWYLYGFEDAYRGRLAIIPGGPAGEQYKKGYTEGLAAIQRDFFAAALN
jgi:hypothetical protein